MTPRPSAREGEPGRDGRNHGAAEGSGETTRSEAFSFLRRRRFPDILAVVSAYLLAGLGITAYASRVFRDGGNLVELGTSLPLLVLAVLPFAAFVILLFQLRSIFIESRRHRYGSRLRGRLSLFFLLTLAAASLPQGLFVIRVGSLAREAATSPKLRKGLSDGLELLLGYYDEDLSRLERLALRELPSLVNLELPRGMDRLLEALRTREPRIEAVERFGPGPAHSFAGSEAAKLESAPGAGIRGPLPASSGGGVGRLRYASPLQDSVFVLTLRLPAGFDEATAALATARRNAEQVAQDAEGWPRFIGLLYILFVLPLILLALLLGLSAADLVVEPLFGLEDAMRRVASGDFTLRLIVKPGDETGSLMASFNRMLAEIERYREGDLRKGKIDAWKDIAQRLAHELKNPLTPIRLAAERLLRAYRKDPARAAEILEGSMLAIVTEVEGMDALLQDFRAFASLPEPQRGWVGLSGLLEESLALYRASYPEIDFTLGPLPEDLQLRVDRAQIKRALGNLLANAIEAMDGTGRISLSADLVKTAESRYCRVRLVDTGRGIPPEIGEKIFAPYFTTKETGTGLGLAIALRIVEDHGGSLRFESEEGVGTSFYMDLPLDS